MKYKSRIDVYNYIVLAVTAIILALPNFLFDFSWIYLAFMIAFDIFFLGQTFSTSYKFNEDELEIRSGVFKFGVYYDRILKITKVQNMFDGAYSTARQSIRIEFGDKDAKKPFAVDISPAKEDEFIAELQKRCEGIGEIENRRK